MIQLRNFLAIAVLATAIFGLIEANPVNSTNLLKSFDGLDEKIRRPLENIIKDLRPKFLLEIENYQKKVGQNVESRRNNLNQFLMEELGNELLNFVDDLKNETLEAAEIEDASKLAERVDEFAADFQAKTLPKVLAKIDQTRNNAVQKELPSLNNEINAAAGRIRAMLTASLNKNLGTKFTSVSSKDIPQALEKTLVPAFEKSVRDFWKDLKDKYQGTLTKQSKEYFRFLDNNVELRNKVDKMVEQKKNEVIDYIAELLNTHSAVSLVFFFFSNI